MGNCGWSVICEKIIEDERSQGKSLLFMSLSAVHVSTGVFRVQKRVLDPLDLAL